MDQAVRIQVLGVHPWLLRIFDQSGVPILRESFTTPEDALAFALGFMGEHIQPILFFRQGSARDIGGSDKLFRVVQVNSVGAIDAFQIHDLGGNVVGKQANLRDVLATEGRAGHILTYGISLSLRLDCLSYVPTPGTIKMFELGQFKALVR